MRAALLSLKPCCATAYHGASGGSGSGPGFWKGLRKGIPNMEFEDVQYLKYQSSKAGMAFRFFGMPVAGSNLKPIR